MKQKSEMDGTAVVFLESDPEAVRPLAPENMSETQEQVFGQLPEEQRQRIAEGCAALVVDLGSRETICEFNTEHYRPPEFALESLARALFPAIREFYSHEENCRAFEDWKKRRDETLPSRQRRTKRR